MGGWFLIQTERKGKTIVAERKKVQVVRVDKKYKMERAKGEEEKLNIFFP